MKSSQEKRVSFAIKDWKTKSAPILSSPYTSTRSMRHSISYPPIPSASQKTKKLKSLPKFQSLPIINGERKPIFTLPITMKNDWYRPIRAEIVNKLFEVKKKYPSIAYHFHEHTIEDFVPSLMTLIRESDEKLDTSTKKALILAGYAHDMGFAFNGSANNHEAIGAKMLEQIVSRYSIPRNTIDFMKECIMATKLHFTPNRAYQKVNNFAQALMADADLYNLGGSLSEFFRKNLLVLKELIENSHNNITIYQHYKFSELLLQEAYHTKSARRLRGAGRRKNLAFIRKTLHILGNFDNQRGEQFFQTVKNVLIYFKKNGLPLNSLILYLFLNHPSYHQYAEKIKSYIVDLKHNPPIKVYSQYAFFPHTIIPPQALKKKLLLPPISISA